MPEKPDDDVVTFKLSEAVAEMRAQHKPLRVDLEDGGAPLEIPPIPLWPRQALKAITGGSPDPEGAIERLLKPDELRRLDDAGGNAAMLLKLIEKQAGATLGESEAS